MFTPQEIKEKEFSKAVFGGYDMAAVDDFLEELTADYTDLYKENGALKGKIKVLVEKVEEYRSSEEAMRMAILSAQKMGDDIIERANAKSAEIIAKAVAESDGKLNNIDDKIDKENDRLLAAQSATRDFVNAQRALLAQQVAYLDTLESSIGLEDKVETVDELEASEDYAVQAAAEADIEAEKREDEIIDAAREIDSAVSKLFDDFVPDSAIPTENAGDVFRRKTADSDWSDDDEPTSPRPKFNFDNLQFGENYSANDK